LEGLASSEPAPSLIIFLMSSCSVCRESMPFYRELSSTTRAERPRVIAISFEPEASLRVGFQKVGTPVFQNLSPSGSAHRTAGVACLKPGVGV